MTTTTDRDPHAALERARSDYLAVSRGAHLYSSALEHERAEEIAWERLVEAQGLMDVQGHDDDATSGSASR